MDDLRNSVLPLLGISCGDNLKDIPIVASKIAENSSTKPEKNLPKVTNTPLAPNPTLDSTVTTQDSILAVSAEAELPKKTIYKDSKPLKKVRNKSRKSVKTPKSLKKDPITFVASQGNLERFLKKAQVDKFYDSKTLKHNFDMPEDAIRLIQSVRKTNDNELEIRWKSTWMIERVSDARFQDDKLRLHVDGDKIITSGKAIGIRYKNKTHYDLILQNGFAYIPKISAYRWKIGK